MADLETEAYCDTKSHSRAHVPPAVVTGLTSATMIATTRGWYPAGDLLPGDQVLSFDHGLQPIADLGWDRVAVRTTPMHMIHIPANSLGNAQSLHVTQDQAILIESDIAQDVFDDPFVALRAADLVGYRDIARVPCRQAVELVTLYFRNPQMIYAQGGILLHCPRLGTDADTANQPNASSYEILNTTQASMLMSAMQNDGWVLGPRSPDIRGCLQVV